MRVATFNIRVGIETSLEHIIRDLQALNLDVIALQEIGVHWCMGDGLDQPREIAEKLGMNSAFGPALWARDFPYEGPKIHRTPLTENGAFGIALLSKYPMTSRFTALPRISGEPRGVLSARIQTPAGELSVFTTHLSTNEDERLLQVDALAHEVPQNSRAMILGDFNAQPKSAVISKFFNCFPDFLDAFTTAGYGPRESYPTCNPTEAIDYIFCRNCKIVRANCLRDVRSSDHCPVFAEIEI